MTNIKSVYQQFDTLIDSLTHSITHKAYSHKVYPNGGPKKENCATFSTLTHYDP